MKKSIVAAAIFVAILLVPASRISAFVPLEIKPGALKGVLEIWKAQRCEKVKTNAEKKLEAIEKKRDKHQTAYQNLISRLEILIEKLESRGYSVADIKTELSMLKTKVEKFGEDYQKFFDLMAEVKTQACGGETDNQVKAKLLEARTQLKTVRQDAKEIREYYDTVIRPDIKALKNQTPSN